MGIVDTLMVGPLGPEAIGGVGLAGILFFAMAACGMGCSSAWTRRRAGLRRRRSRRLPALAVAGPVARPVRRVPLAGLLWLERITHRSGQPGHRRRRPRQPRRAVAVAAAAVRLRRVAPLSAGDRPGAAGDVRAARRQRRQRHRQLGADLRPPRPARARHRRRRLGDAGRTDAMAIVPLAASSGTTSGTTRARRCGACDAGCPEGARDPAPPRHPSDAADGVRGRRLRAGVLDGGQPAAGGDCRAPGVARARRPRLHGPARHRLGGGRARRPRVGRATAPAPSTPAGPPSCSATTAMATTALSSSAAASPDRRVLARPRRDPHRHVAARRRRGLRGLRRRAGDRRPAPCAAWARPAGR